MGARNTRTQCLISMAHLNVSELRFSQKWHAFGVEIWVLMTHCPLALEFSTRRFYMLFRIPRTFDDNLELSM